MNTIEQYSQGYNDVLHDESQKYLKGYHNDLRLDIPDQQQMNNPRINNRVIQRGEEQRRYLDSLQQYSGRSDGSKFADFSNPNHNNMSPFDRLSRNNSNGHTSSRSNINAPVGLFATLGANDPSMIPVTERRANQMKYSKMLNESATALPLMKTYTKLEKSRPYTPSDSTKLIGTGVVEDLSQRYQPRVLDEESQRKIEKQREYVQQLSFDKERYNQEREAQYERDIRNGVIPKQEFNSFGESTNHNNYPNHNVSYETEKEYMEKVNKQHNYSTQLDLDKEIARQQEAILEQQNFRNSGSLKVREMQTQIIDNRQEFVIGKHPEELRLQKEEQRRQYRHQLDKQKEIDEIALKNVEEQNKRYYLKEDESVLPYEHKAAPIVDRHNYNQQRQLLIQENLKLQQQQVQQQHQYKEQLLQQQHQQQQQLLQQQRMEQDFIRTNSQRYINPLEQEEKERRRQEILKQQQLHDEITAAAHAKPIPTERVSLYNKYKRVDEDSKKYQGSLVVGGRSYHVDPEEARQRKIQLQHEYSRQIAESASTQPIQNERRPLYYQKNQNEVNDVHNGRILMPNPVLSSRSELPQFNELMTTLTLPKLYQGTAYQ